MFVVFDGLDGTGKSTQLRLFAEWLVQQGREVVICQDPGTTRLGNELRTLLLHEQGFQIHMRCELLLFMAARAQLVEQVIRPALALGQTVICDRYVFSTVVYQGYGGGIDPQLVWQLNQFATNGLMADLTLIFDLDAATSQSRLGTAKDRLESRGMEYFQKLRDGFIQEANRFPTGVSLIDARGTVEQVQQRVRQRWQEL